MPFFSHTYFNTCYNVVHSIVEIGNKVKLLSSFGEFIQPCVIGVRGPVLTKL